MAVLNSFLRPLLGTRVCSGSVRHPFGFRARSVQGPREVRSGSVEGSLGVRSESVRDPREVRLGSARGSFGVRSGSVRQKGEKYFWRKLLSTAITCLGSDCIFAVMPLSTTVLK